jgi:hypothetical protein
MGRLVLVAAVLTLLLVAAGCGSSSSHAKKKPPPIPRNVLVLIARKAQGEMRTKLHDKTIVVRSMQCRPASSTAYGCGLGVVHGRRQQAAVVIGVRFNPATNSGVMSFVGSSNRRWGRILTQGQRRAG